MSLSQETISVEPLVDSFDAAAGLDMTLPLMGVNLAGVRGGSLKSRVDFGGTRFKHLREYEEGDDLTEVDFEAMAEDPDHIPMITERHADITPSLWIASDMLTHHKRGIDGYYDKQGLAVSAMFALMRTALSSRNQTPLPLAIAVGNDYQVDLSDKPRSGRSNTLDLASRISQSLQQEGPLAVLDDRPNLSQLLRHVGANARKKVVAVVSDFRGPHFSPDSPKDNWKAELGGIAEAGNSIIAVEIVAPEDAEIPEQIQTIGHSPKGRIWAGRQGKGLRQIYGSNSERQQQMIDDALESVNAVHIRLRTDSPDWQSSLREQLVYPQARVS